MVVDQGNMWADAIGQIFFSIGVCIGVMTSYGSYNAKKKPIIADAVIVSVTNSMISFVSGFAVWSIIGYLAASGVDAPSGGTSLVFIAYPNAINTLQSGNFWAALLGITLWLLGLDSAMGFVEAAVTVIQDATDEAYPRICTVTILCVVGIGLSMLFCTNWGVIFFDVVDHYCAVYLLFFVGILQCFGCGWAFDWARSANISPAH